MPQAGAYRTEPSIEPVLAGLVVLRLGRSLAGDLLCALLSDAGAAIEEPGESVPGKPAPRVVINDLGRGSTAPDGFSYAAIKRSGRSVIYCSLVSFPENGPKGLPELEDDPVLAVLGVNQVDGNILFHEPLRMPSLYGAQMAAIYIACALLRQNAFEGPQFIEVPLFSAALNVLGRLLVEFHDRRLTDPLTVNHLFPISVPRKCADGRYIQPHGMFPHFVKTLFRTAGHPEWAEEASRGLFSLPDRESIAMWDRRMTEMFSQRPADEWELTINAAGGACTLCRTYEEWSGEEHPRLSGILAKAPAAGQKNIGPGLTLRPSAGPGPRRSETPVPAAPDRRPLAGIKVVDFCIIIAGPTVGRVLADLGAEVVKVDAPNRVPNPYLWMDTNRGKRSLVLDLRMSEGRAIAATLARQADIVIENFRKGKLARHGVGYDDVARSNPHVIYASTNLFDQDGPWAGRAGWEHNAQAATGMQWDRSRDGVPRHVPFPVNDYATGLFGALGIVLALLGRERTGHGARVTASLARSATVLQAVQHNPLTLSRAASRRSVRCCDGWVGAYLDAAQVVSGFTMGPEFDGTVSMALETLATDGYAAVAEASPAMLKAASWLDECGLRIGWDHPKFGTMSQTVAAGTMDGFTLVPRHPAPSPGADNAAILADIGYADRFDELARTGVVQQFPLFPAA